MRLARTELSGLHHSSPEIDTEATRIRLVWAKGDNTFELAKVVSETRQRLQWGQWTQLWRWAQMPFCKRKAETLVAIDAGLGWAGPNAHICARMPRAWLTLYYLARLDRKDLEELVEAGAVHPRLTLAQAKELVVAISRGCAPNEAKHPPVLQRLEKLKDFIDCTMDAWSVEQLALAEAELEGMLLKVSTYRRWRPVAESVAVDSDAAPLDTATGQASWTSSDKVIPLTERDLRSQTLRT